MDSSTAHKVAAWLGSLPNVRNVRPVRVTIGKQDYFGARYDSVGHYTRDMMACTHRGVEPGTEYTQDRIYLAARRPKFKRNGKTCMPFDGLDWYIGCYSPDVIEPQFAPYHPFGHSFMVMPWSVPDGQAIDHYEDKPYDRIPMAVEPLSPIPTVSGGAPSGWDAIEADDEDHFPAVGRHEAMIRDRFGLTIDDANEEGCLFVGTPRQVETFLDHINLRIQTSKPGEDWMNVTHGDGTRIGQIDSLSGCRWGFSAINAALAPILDRWFPA